ncbi:hypothetical protein [Flavobacterium dankookense]|uniref:Cyclic nucleotide-binding domain-containing protein n=1 Tax=Flavobacterium dankookense TaxID=706186 RepID=A0A4V3CRW5_9FLAO|nr:hypothetical protein [Flavobacterium dankookense]TDP58312.1 hypothetical protein BC748_2351 [Flavobacterium dankookense]
MKKSLFLYLFIIAVLMNVFTYKYFASKGLDEVNTLKIENKKLKDSTLVMYNKSIDDNSFSLEFNDRAQNYLNQNNLAAFSEKVKQALLAYNDDPAGNKYVDQGKVGEQKFIINKLKILNHRWIIADYSNGELWGEVLIKYFVEEDQSITFQTMDSYLYPQQLN